MNTIGVIVLFASNCVLLFWNLRLRSKLADLSYENRKRREWHQRQLDRSKERI